MGVQLLADHVQSAKICEVQDSLPKKTWRRAELCRIVVYMRPFFKNMVLGDGATFLKRDHVYIGPCTRRCGWLRLNPCDWQEPPFEVTIQGVRELNGEEREGSKANV